MMIIVSPSKTYQLEAQAPLQPTQPVYQGEAKRLYGQIADWSKEEIQSRMKLSDKLADQVYEIYQDQAREKSATAITYYTGLVYKQLDLPKYGEDEWTYIQSHLRILSAMYGVLRPHDQVAPYRLDFQMKIPGERLIDLWKVNLKDYWKDEILVDLSSNEFGRLLPNERIRIQFIQKNKKGEWKSQSTLTKMARGKMLNWMVQRQIKTPEEIQVFDLDSYAYDSERSSERNWIFCQKQRA